MVSSTLMYNEKGIRGENTKKSIRYETVHPMTTALNMDTISPTLAYSHIRLYILKTIIEMAQTIIDKLA
ncbi:hypothetical protein D3C73_596400 [compost metagenome]